MPEPRNQTEDDITAEALQRFARDAGPTAQGDHAGPDRAPSRFRQGGRPDRGGVVPGDRNPDHGRPHVDDKRQEFILFSDTLGVSMVVDLLTHRKPDGATKSTVFGPFHRQSAPELPWGGNIAHLDKKGMPTLVGGRVLDLDGRPIAGALLDVWQAQTNGLYDSQDPGLHECTCGANSAATPRAGIWCAPCCRFIPDPVRRPGRGDAARDRPASLAPGAHPFRRLGRRLRAGDDPIFDRADEYLGSDAVFAVKDSLICEFTRHEAPDAEAGRLGIEGPYCARNSISV